MFDLLTELKEYQPFDEDEAVKVEQVKTFLKTNNNCYDRSNLEGHITAGALVCDDAGNILLNHHKAADMWFQFGGHSDKETDSWAVAKREVFEESGIEKFKLCSNKIFDVDVQQVTYSAKKNEPEHYHYDINFLFIVEDHNFNISNESVEIKWATIDQARELVNKSDVGMLRMITKYELYLKTKQA